MKQHSFRFYWKWLHEDDTIYGEWHSSKLDAVRLSKESERNYGMISRDTIEKTMFLTMIVTASFFVLAAIIIPPWDEQPAGVAGLSAATVALCTAFMFLIKNLSNGKLKLRPSPDFYIALGIVFSSYLWMSDANDNHVLSLELPILLLVYIVVAAVFTSAMLAFTIYFSRTE